MPFDSPSYPRKPLASPQRSVNIAASSLAEVLRRFRNLLEDETVALPDKPDDKVGLQTNADEGPVLKPTEAELSRQRKVMLSVIDRAAPLFQALAKK